MFSVIEPKVLAIFERRGFIYQNFTKKVQNFQMSLKDAID